MNAWLLERRQVLAEALARLDAAMQHGKPKDLAAEARFCKALLTQIEYRAVEMAEREARQA